MKISIVMPSFNQGHFIAAAIDSIVAQDYKKYEIIIVDGGSCDTTLEEVFKRKDRISRVISESDEGQSHALTKGFSLATGDIFTWLSTDDLLLPGALSSVCRAIEEEKSCEWFLGNVAIIDRNSRVLKCRRGTEYSRFWQRLGVLTAAGPSAFFSRSLYERVGGLNQSLHYKMDTDLWWRFFHSGARFKRLEGYTWALRLHADAKTSAHYFRQRNDPKVMRALADQEKEQKMIEAFMAQSGVYCASCSGMAAKLRRGLSAEYYQSLFDTRRWSGRHVADVFDNQRD